MSSAQNSCHSESAASLSLPATLPGGTGFGYAGCDMIRMTPFCVSGQEAQPASMFALSQRAANEW